jgi:thioredoxin 2
MSDTQLIRCPACGASNRVPREKIEQGLEPVCGRRQTPLPVLLDMWATRCGPCRMMEPVIDELAAELAGRARVLKLNVDENPATAARFNARSIPTLLAPKAGREVDRIVGAQPRSEIARRLERIMA